MSFGSLQEKKAHVPSKNLAPPFCNTAGKRKNAGAVSGTKQAADRTGDRHVSVRGAARSSSSELPSAQAKGDQARLGTGY